MKVALFHDFLVRMGGAENVLAVFAELFPDAPIYTVMADYEAIEKRFPGLSKRVIPVASAQRTFKILRSIPFIGKKATKFFLRSMPYYVENIDMTDFDFVMSNSTAWGHGLVPTSNTKFMCYMHSPMRFAWDWFNEYKSSLGVKNHTSLRNLFLTSILGKARMWDQIALKKQSLLLCNSVTVKKRIEKFYKRTDAHVLNPPVDIHRIQAPKSQTATHRDYFLIISTLAKYKHVHTVVQLFNKLGRKLVIIGDGPERPYLQQLAADNISFVGGVSDTEKFDYLQGCRALIFPSHDDFGITPIEAMAAGKPVLAYQAGGALETVISGVTGEFFDEQTVESMEKGLAKLLEKEETFDPLRIREHAEHYSKHNFIRKLKTILRSELGIDIKPQS